MGKGKPLFQVCLAIIQTKTHATYKWGNLWNDEL